MLTYLTIDMKLNSIPPYALIGSHDNFGLSYIGKTFLLRCLPTIGEKLYGKQNKEKAEPKKPFLSTPIHYDLRFVDRDNNIDLFHPILFIINGKLLLAFECMLPREFFMHPSTLH